MNIVEKSILIFTFLVVVVATFWIQISNEEENIVEIIDPNDNIDYYVTNFTTTNIDKHGIASHVVEGELLTHYAHDDTANISTPHIIEYKEDGITQHTYGETAWIGPAGERIKISNNVKVYEHASIRPGSEAPSPQVTEVMSTNELVIVLREPEAAGNDGNAADEDGQTATQ